MSKTLTANFTTEKNKTAGAKIRTLFEVDTDSGTLYYSDQALTVSAQAYTANVMAWPSRIINQIRPGEEVVRTSSARFEINNNPRIDDDIRPGLEVRLYLWFEGLTAADKLLWFKGIINNNIEITAYRVSFTALDIGDWFDKQIGIPLDIATYPNADPDDIGKIQPILYGDLTDQPCLAIVAGAVSTLVNDIAIGASSMELTDASAFPSSGTLIIGDEEDITYSGKSGNTLTGVANVSNAYDRASRVMEKIASLKYMVAGHIVKAITNPRILPFGMKLEDAVRIDTGDFSVNLNDGGIATVTVTEISNVKKAVAVRVTVQPDQPITTQQTQVSPNHGHAPPNVITGVYCEDVIFVSSNGSQTTSNIDQIPSRIIDNDFLSFGRWISTGVSAGTANRTVRVKRVTAYARDGTPVSLRFKMQYNGVTLIGTSTAKLYINGVLKQTINFSSGANTMTSSFHAISSFGDINNTNTYVELFFNDNGVGFTEITIDQVWFEVQYTPVNPLQAVTINESIAAVSNRITDAVVGGNSVADTLGGILIVDAEGYPDDNPAHYTDVADSLIEEPWDVIHHILENLGNGVTDSDIDLAGSFQDAEDNLPASYKFAFSIRQKIGMNRLLAMLAQQTWCRFIWEAGIAKLNRIKLSGASSKSIDTDTDSYISSDRRIQVRKSPKGLSEIYNDIEVKYDLNYTLGNWGTPDAFGGSSESISAASIASYKTRQRTWLMFAIGDNISMADDVRDKLLEFYQNPRPTISFPGWLKNIEVERGDVADLIISQLVINQRLYEAIGVDLQVPHPVNRQRPELMFSFLDLLFIALTLSDTLSLSESVVKAVGKNLSDSVPLAEAVVLAPVKIIAEDMILGDGTEEFLANGDHIADGTIFAVGVLGSFVITVGKGFSESLAISEVVGVVLNPP